MKIQVTQEDIDKGEKNLCHKCAIALAATRAFGKPMKAMRWRIEDPATGKSFTTPKEVGTFMFRYDDGLPVKPFEFELAEARPLI